MIRALVVDDSRIIIGIISRLIKQCKEEILLESVTNGFEALAKLKENRYDLLFLDLLMPNIDGYTVLSELLQFGQSVDLKIIMITSLDQEDDLKKCFELGASDYIVKPINPVIFISRVNAAIQEQNVRRNYKATIELLETKNFELNDLQTRLIRTQNQLIQNEQLNALGLLAAGMAHEINNPLGYLKGNLSTLVKYIRYLLSYIDERCLSSDLENKPEVGLSIDLIRSEVESVSLESKEGITKIESIINELRSFSGVDQIEEIDEINLSRDLDVILNLVAAENKALLTINTDYPDNMIVRIPVGKFNIAVAALLKNAVESLLCSQKTDKVIAVSASIEKNYLNLMIRDTGIGIELENINKIFQPFFTTKVQSDAVGLGLSTTRNIIVTQLKGTIEISSALGEGTNVYISIPLIH